MTEWYYAEGQERKGPVPEQTLRQMFQRGELSLQTLVWREGMEQWAALSTRVDELQLQTLAAATANASEGGGIDLRGDYAAIDNGTAPLPGSGPITASPYAAPASSLADGGVPGSAVHGGEVVYAGFWKRVAAYIIDYIILLVISMVIGGLFGVITYAAGESSLAGKASQIVSFLVTLVVTVGYYAWFHASTGGATPGKMAIGIKVVRTTGEQISIARAIGRYFASVISAVLLCIGFIMAAFTERKQGLHDMISDTVVVDRWAFTDQPHLQRRELGTVTIVVLVIGAIVFVTMFALAIFAAGVIARMAG